MAPSASLRATIKRIDALLANMDENPETSFQVLAEMSLEEQVAYIEWQTKARFDIEPIKANVALKFGTDLATIDRGVQLDDARLKALEGKIEQAARQTARLAAKQTMRIARQSIYERADARPDYEQLYIWVAIMGPRTCASCEGRHGQIFALDYWNQIGKPGDGSTQCGEECKCDLMPWDGPVKDATKKRILI